MLHLIWRLDITAGLVAALLLTRTLGSGRVAAQGEPGGITIYSYQCPEGFEGGDDTSCRDHQLAGVGFTLFEEGQHSGIGATSDADGVASLGLPISEPATINLLVQPPAGYESSDVACSEAYAGIDGGAAVSCGIYALPAEPVVADDGADSITTLPNTGLGSAGGDSGSDALIPVLLGTVLTLLAGLVRFRRAV